MKKLTPENYRSMPWKNGAGTTIEIAVFPENAAIADFTWRVSRAQVVSDGGFSHFDGIDRSLALLGGQGMRLTSGGVAHQVDQQNTIAIFAGDVATHAELLDGPISDFNLMTRRTVCSHVLTHWVGQAEHKLPDNAMLLYCARGAGMIIGKQSHHELNTDEAVQFLSNGEVAEFTLHSRADSIFYCVQITMNEC
jgi:environmental stress-induced protein Ves